MIRGSRTAGDQGAGRISASTKKSENAEPTAKRQQNANIDHQIQTSWRRLRFFDEHDHVVAQYSLSLEIWSDVFEINCFVSSENDGAILLGELCGSGVFFISDGFVIPDIVRIAEAHRRRGLATTICDIAAEHSGVPWGEPTLLTDGMKFWPAYRGQPSTSLVCAEHSAQPAMQCPLPMTSRGSRTTAYHEAGHVVASLLTGHLVHQVQIGDYPGTLINRHGQPVVCAGLMDGSLGVAMPAIIKATLTSNPGAKANIIRRAVDNVFLSGAGPAAEARFSRRGWPGTVLAQVWATDGDYADAMASLEPLVTDPAKRSRMVLSIWEISRRFVARPTVWKAITALAEELHANGKLGYDQIEACLLRQGLARVPYGQRVLTP